MKFSFLILLLLFGHVGYAQISQNDFKNVTPKDGLSQSSVYSIYQDGKGFMWFGTFNGLNRYDGRTIKEYLPHVDNDTIKSLSHGHIRGLDGDKRGKIFIATFGGGLNVLDLNTDKINYFKRTDSLSIIDDYLSTVLYVDDTTVWVASTKGVSRFNPKNKTFHNYPFKRNKSNSSDIVRAFSLFVDRNRVLWIGTYGNGLLKLNQKDGSFKHYKNQSSSKNIFNINDIRSIIEYSNDQLLVTTNAGLYTFNPGTGKYKLFGLAGKELRRVVRDLNGNYWVTTFFDGLYKVDVDGKVTLFNNNPYDNKSFTDNRLYSVYCDDIGNVWVGTSSSGAVAIIRDRKPFTNIYEVANKPSIPENSVFDFSEDKNGRVWIGTEKGLSVWDRKNSTFETIGLRIDGALRYDLAIWNLLLLDNNDLWIATSLGVFVYNVKSRKQHHYSKRDDSEKGFLNNDIDCLGKGNGSVWIASVSSVCEYNLENKTFTNYFAGKSANSLSHSRVRQIYSDRKGQLWFCTADGLNLYNPKQNNFKVYRFDNILSNDITSIYEVRDGELWLATSKGISIFDSEKGEMVKNIGVKEGLPDGFVYKLLESGNSVWASTNNGLVEIDKVSYKVINSYCAQDGLQANEFNPAAIKLKDGYFLFGGINGITGFYPNTIHKSTFVPPLYFTGLSVFGKEVTANDTLKSDKVQFKKSIISASKIEFSPHEKVFSIRFEALDYSNPDRIEYYFRMLPTSTEWISLGSQNFVTFSNLNPGMYGLEVKSTNGDGVLCDNVKKISIVIQPPFWRKKWVVWIEILLLVSGLFLIFKIRTYRLRREKAKLEEIVTKRTREIAKQKDKLEQFAANLEEKVNQRTTELKIAKQSAEESDRLKSAFLSNMSHEIRTPMNAILGFSELLSSPGFDEDERLNFAKMVKTNGDALLTLLNDIIDISMIESGQLKLNFNDVNVYNLVNSVYLVFENSLLFNEKQEVNMKLNVIDDVELIIKTDSQRLLQILNNLVGNALKFTEKGCVEFGYKKEDRKLLFFVKDTGIGITEEGLSKIFDRFHKLNNDSSFIYGGNGLGLTITKNLVEALNGKIWAESKEGIGTTFFFSLPL